ncbi:Ribokinase-like protein [Armillaria borealis]|uniref:Ribokinase-like protein n=1 Tax=Armillaria borealis TaxID=47425 RepID=A0AA39K2M9_9AGAR|nr:Ribokinase-like protein [Armillaria borealis]
MIDNSGYLLSYRAITSTFILSHLNYPSSRMSPAMHGYGTPQFVTLGMFIIDEFSFLDDDGNPTGKELAPQIGGGGTYAAVGARIWLPPDKIGMIVDRGNDWPSDIQEELDKYGPEMWMYRDQLSARTTRALNSYMGDHRSFDYLTTRIRITPRDLRGTRLARAPTLHFVCSPSRAHSIVSEIHEEPKWHPTTIWEPIPDRCVPEELPALIKVLPHISVLSPNAEEALLVLSMALPPTKTSIEEAAEKFLDFGVGSKGRGSVIIRSGELGAYVATRANGGKWVDAFWADQEKVVDVTGAGNSFLGGLGAGLYLAQGDVYQATLYATISAAFVIEQEGLPQMSELVDDEGSTVTLWNGDSPERRLRLLQDR